MVLLTRRSFSLYPRSATGGCPANLKYCGCPADVSHSGCPADFFHCGCPADLLYCGCPANSSCSLTIDFSCGFIADFSCVGDFDMHHFFDQTQIVCYLRVVTRTHSGGKPGSSTRQFNKYPDTHKP